MILMRWRWQARGGSIYVRVFTASRVDRQSEPLDRQLAFCGFLTFPRHDWVDICALLSPQVEVLEEDASRD
jgi:hypothetical protein